MSTAGNILLGLVGGAVVVAASREAGLDGATPALIGGSTGLVLALLAPDSREAGLALALASVGGSMAASNPRVRRQLRLRGVVAR